MHIESRTQGADVIMTVQGRMDALNAPEFETTCAAVVAEGGSSLVVDLSGLEYISSAGLRSILTAVKQMRGAGGRIVFCGLGGMVADVFRISGFLKMFQVYSTVEEAVAG